MEVWGAVLASTLTTVAIFLPVVFIKEEVGQLFRDIAIAISSAVTLSLFVSVLVIPTLARLIGERISKSTPSKISTTIAEYGQRIQNNTMRFSSWINISPIRCLATITILVAFSVGMVYILFPKMEYLPQGNMNMTQSRFIIQSGLSLEERSTLADMFYRQAQEYMGEGKEGYPVIDKLSYSVQPAGMFAMATAKDPERAAELVPLLSGLIRNIPGVGGFTTQMGIFQNRQGGGRSMEVVLSGKDIDAIARATGRLIQLIPEVMPGVQVRSRPSVEMTFPEVVFKPIPERLMASGMNPTSLGAGINVYVDGRKVGEYRDPVLGNIDLVMNVPIQMRNNPEELSSMLLPIADGEVVPIFSLADLYIGTGMEGIRRFERERTFILTVTPPPNMVLQELMEGIQERAIEPLRQDGLLDNIRVHYAGSASRLVDAKNALQINFLLALVITYLLMAALFNNFFYPFVIMFSVPMAMAGGFIGLTLVDTFIAAQSLDMLTMLGFVMLIGIVTNGAILIVHQALNNLRLYGMKPPEAIQESVRTRLRPIAMSVATSVFGMMPLVLFSGAGSELYRGLGSVLLGGLVVSTMFTVFMIPAILSLTMGRRK
jgi:HAE1 family hydrophobic/amphiphilic exporter-1